MKKFSTSRTFLSASFVAFVIGLGGARIYAQTATNKAPLVSPMVVPSSAKWTKGKVVAVAAGGKRVFGYFWSDKNAKWKEWFWTPGKGLVEGNAVSVDQALHAEKRPEDITREQKAQEWDLKFGSYGKYPNIKFGSSFPKNIGNRSVTSIHAKSISNDSKFVVGTYFNADMKNTAYGRVFIWTEKQGFQDLVDFASLDEKRYGNLNDFSAAVSPDGSVVVIGTNYADITIIKL